MNVEMYNERDLITMKLLHYFITIKNYNPVIVQGAKNEIWLENLGEDIKKLGFGLMRLPKNGDDIDIEQTKQMVDMFMDAGMGYEEAQTFDIVVLQTNDGIFLRFRLEEIPEKKKGAVGVKGIKLNEDDYVSKVYVIDAGDNTVVECNGKQVSLRNLKTNKRGAKGTKVRGK